MAKALRSTRVLTPQGFAPAAVIVEHEHIAAVCGWDEVPQAAELLDFGDLVLLPGLVDTHVHINEPGRTEWEGFTTATQAAAAGGVTTLVDMPLNCAPETVNVDALEAKRSAAQGKTWVDWAAWGGVVRGNAESLQALAQAGVAGFKCFLIHSGIDGFKWVEEADLRAALEKFRGSELPLLVHAEVPGPVNSSTNALHANDADWRSYSVYMASRPPLAEVLAVEMLMRLADDFDTPIHIVHLSAAQALPLLTSAKRYKLPITVETCVHYLWFAAEDIPDGATQYKCAPPIRSGANREALWKALEQGLIDMVTTDHSPCPPAMKRRDEGRWDLAWGGIGSLGLALPVMWTAMCKRGVKPERVGEWMAAAPARLAGLKGRKGTLAAGADADLVVFNPDESWIVTPADLHFRHKLSPYLNAQLRGRVEETWLRGEPVFRAGRFLGEARGRELVRR
jgi:allantoinase